MAEIVQQQIFALEKKVGTDAKSPMFAQLANLYLEQNRAEDALRICDAGLANYPFYTTGHLIKGKALVALHMRAEARREFEFVLEILPRNETVISLLEQIPLGEDETLIAPPHKEQTRIIKPEYVTPSLDENRIPPTQQIYPEQEFGFTGLDQSVQEQTTELPTEPTSVGEQTFFDAITQTPIEKTTEDILETAAPSVEMPEMPEPPSIGGFDIQMPESPSLAETQETTFADIPRTVPEPSTEYEFHLEATEEEGVAQAPSEEEAFALYASRRRAELKGENTISLDDYLSNAAIIPAEEVSIEISVPTGVQDSIEDAGTKEEQTIDMTILPSQMPTGAQDSIEDAGTKEEQTIDMTILPSQIPTGAQDSIEDAGTKEEQTIDMTILPSQMPKDMQSRIDDTDTNEEKPTDTSIILPQIQPAELPISDSIQNNIEEIANKLKDAGKITPVIDIAQKETSPASEQDLPVSMGFVTPTLAEIYAKQGWFDDAIKAYKALARNKPAEKERFEKRIEELEKLKNQSKK